MEQLIEVMVQNGLGVASFIAFIWFIFKYEDKQSDILSKISETLIQVQLSLSSLTERVDKIERNTNKKDTQ